MDLLLVDSGDLHDGTGLVDGFPPGGVDAHDANEFVKKIPYDRLSRLHDHTAHSSRTSTQQQYIDKTAAVHMCDNRGRRGMSWGI